MVLFDRAFAVFGTGLTLRAIFTAWLADAIDRTATALLAATFGRFAMSSFGRGTNAVGLSAQALLATLGPTAAKLGSSSALLPAEGAAPLVLASLAAQAIVGGRGDALPRFQGTTTFVLTMELAFGRPMFLAAKPHQEGACKDRAVLRPFHVKG